MDVLLIGLGLALVLVGLAIVGRARPVKRRGRRGYDE
jgi:hypothetical protein